MKAPGHWQRPPQDAITLDEADIHIWLFDMDVNEVCQQTFRNLLSTSEKARCDRFKFEKDRKHFAASHGFMRSTLARYLHGDAHSLRFAKGQYGKPFVADEGRTTQLKFNLSHSGRLAMLAVCLTDDIGVDIECVDRNVNWQGIINRYFSQYEKDGISALPAEQRRQGFIQQWSRKESYMKVLGYGLSLSPLDFSLSTPPDRPALIEHMSTKFSPPEYIDFFDITLPSTISNYRACCAHQKPGHKISLYMEDNCRRHQDNTDEVRLDL
jgi:4'-phosphopantetheinyl transferase